MRTLKVKIVKASSPRYWYAGLIGEEIEVIDELGSAYSLTHDSKKKHHPWMYVGKSDVEVIKQ